MKDCGFTDGRDWFRFRTGGILVHDDRMLFVECSEGAYFYMIGGGVHMGETSKNAVEREIYEETGIVTKADHLSVVCENFFRGRGGPIDGMDCHAIEFYYLMKILDLSGLKERTDTGERLLWLTADEIKVSNIKPSFIKERLEEILSARHTVHIVSEVDRRNT